VASWARSPSPIAACAAPPARTVGRLADGLELLAVEPKKTAMGGSPRSSQYGMRMRVTLPSSTPLNFTARPRAGPFTLPSK
jgi:hypothetical protein